MDKMVYAIMNVLHGYAIGYVRNPLVSAIAIVTISENISRWVGDSSLIKH
jgi:hypothetical protein